MPMIGQSYDGASVMAGHVNGVQKKIREFHHEAIFFHCIAHKLNLVIIGSCKHIKSSVSFFNILESLYVHFSRPSSHNILINIQKQLGIKPREIIQISDTRWACRFENCDMVKQYYGSIIEALDTEVEEGNDFNCVEAEGISNSLKKGNFVVNLFIFYEVFKYINILSKTVQSKSMTLGKALNVIKSVIKTLEDKRNGESFKCLWYELLEFSKRFEINIDIPSNSKRKRKTFENILLKNTVITSTTGTNRIDAIYSTPEEFWRSYSYYEVLDTIIKELNNRFSSESLSMANAIDHFLKLNTIDSDPFIHHYQTLLNIDSSLLKAEMIVAKNCLSKETWELDELIKVANNSVLPNLWKMLKVALILPVTTATCERSFSSMRRIKTWLRSSMEQHRFDSLALLSIEKDILKDINKEKMLDEFAKKSRKLKL